MPTTPINSELVVISIGQCGVQMSSAMWELFNVEHGVSPDGHIMSDDVYPADMNTFYYESYSGELVPRGLCCDLEPSVIDEIRCGVYRDFFHPNCLMNVLDDGASNYARGNITVGKPLGDEAMQQIRRLVNNCDNFQGFLMLSSLTGGTGAGFTNLLTTALDQEYPRKAKFQVGVFPGTRLANSMVDPYNCVFAMSTGMNYMDMTVQFDNESCYEIAADKLQISNPTYNNINRMVSQVCSSITCSSRFPNNLYADLVQMQTNIVPFPHVRFPTVCFAPIVRQECVDHQNVSVEEVTNEVFHPNNIMVNCNLSEGKYMAICLQYRGYASPKEVNAAVANVKASHNFNFVDWCPTGFKIGICSQPNANVPGSGMANTHISLCSVINHTRCVDGVHILAKNFDKLFSKRAFVHSFVGEGMEEGEFAECRDFVEDLLLDYDSVENDPEADYTEARTSKRSEYCRRVTAKSLARANSSRPSQQQKPIIMRKSTEPSQHETEGGLNVSGESAVAELEAVPEIVPEADPEVVFDQEPSTPEPPPAQDSPGQITERELTESKEKSNTSVHEMEEIDDVNQSSTPAILVALNKAKQSPRADSSILKTSSSSQGVFKRVSNTESSPKTVTLVDSSKRGSATDRVRALLEKHQNGRYMKESTPPVVAPAATESEPSDVEDKDEMEDEDEVIQL